MPTEPAMDRESKQQRVKRLERLCHERGLPVTMQRRTVFEMILDREDHPTADQIYDQTRKRIHTISRTTVYRILDTLVGLTLITKICHPGSAARFDPRTHQHDHLVCLHCETILDLKETRSSKVAWPDVSSYGFVIHDHHIHFRGLCANCIEKRGAEERTTQRPGGRHPRTPARATTRPIAKQKRRIPS
ncbi:MAG: transcriptional repressor [Phycisphaerae bacterium]|nr:transcriptional repressor [Phycisphaerae bacterium]